MTAGVVKEIDVAELNVTLAGRTVVTRLVEAEGYMKYTVVDPLTKPEPVMVRGVPPVIGPDGGDVAG